MSCHAKDMNMPPKHPTVRIDETFIGDGVLDYATYLKEIEKLTPAPTLMIEHLNESQLIKGLRFIFNIAAEVGITFEGSQYRQELLDVEDASGNGLRPTCKHQDAFYAWTFGVETVRVYTQFLDLPTPP